MFGSAATALGYPTQFEVLLGQLVNLLRNDCRQNV